ncbi:MAG: tail fiber domain-containing protein [Bacteroidales bacterium]|nr:tail fiber domain-containing protein [Bacteroidales bacterium]
MRTFSTLILIFLFSFSVLGQAIQVDCNNYVGINTSPLSPYRLNVNGSIRCNTSLVLQHSYSDLIIESSGYGFIIRPENNNNCFVGSMNQAFDHMYSYGFTDPSDRRFKENIKEIPNSLELIMD